MIYPDQKAARDRWILERRGQKNVLDPWQPYAFLWEKEIGATGEPIPTATLFLTNRECPYRCLMCDLWQNTLDARVPPGAIAAQIRYALERLPATRQIKLYNAGSFFDPQAIPPEDYPEIAALLAPYERVIVECHPALILQGKHWQAFRDLLSGQLEVAIGLETAHPQTLARLNKRITVDSFRRAADLLAAAQIDLRVFLLLRPPFMDEAMGLEWVCRSLDLAFDSGASVCCVIPTRDGNGAIEALRATGHYAPPKLSSLEAAQEYGLNLRQGRVFSDLWDIERFYTCDCSPHRAERLSNMNRTQYLPPPIVCGKGCGGNEAFNLSGKEENNVSPFSPLRFVAPK
jgi:radical SAM enzyme (TIGR01210 family)